MSDSDILSRWAPSQKRAPTLCMRCKGRGTVSRPIGRDTRDTFIERRCWACGGTGTATAADQRKGAGTP